MTTTTRTITRTDVTPENYEEVEVTLSESIFGLIRLYECTPTDGAPFWQIVIDAYEYEVHVSLCVSLDEALPQVRDLALTQGDGQECECGTVSTRVRPTRDVYGPRGLYAIPDTCPWCPTIF